MADPGKVARVIERITPGSIVRLGGMTDCFQPAELLHRATCRAIEALNRRGVGYLIVTKSPLVASDEYIGLMNPNLAHIQVSVTTTDDTLSRTYERAPPPSHRIKAVERLQAVGFDVTLRLSPFIPAYIDYGRLNGVRCDKVLVEYLRVNT